MVTKLITPELVTAYWFCPRKAFLLLRGDDGEPVHEYISVISQRADRNRQEFLEHINAACLQFDHGVHRNVMPVTVLKAPNCEQRSTHCFVKTTVPRGPRSASSHTC